MNSNSHNHISFIKVLNTKMVSFKQRCYYSVWSTECNTKDELGLAPKAFVSRPHVYQRINRIKNAPHSRYAPQVSTALIFFRTNGFDQ